MTQLVRRLLTGEAALFCAAALLHTGALIGGYHHREAATAESVIAAVLLAGFAISLIAPRWSRVAGLAAQGFALLGTVVGIFTIAIGIGPQTVLDITIHAVMVATLVTGLWLVGRGTTS
jgi:hypothetical protein